MRSLFVLSLAVVLSCGGRFCFAANELPEKAEEVLSKAAEVELISLNPKRVRGGFRNYEELGRTKLAKKVDREAAISAVKEGLKDSTGFSTKCFNPRHALAATHNGTTVHVLICFECLNVQVYVGNKRSMLTIARSPEKVLDKILTAAKVKLAKKKDPQYPPKALGTISGFEEWVMSLAFSPDGKYLAAGTFDRVKLIDAKTRKEVAMLKTRAGYCRGLAFSKDSQTLICGCYQKVILFDVAKKKRLATLRGHRSYITDVELAPDGKTFATSSLDKTVRIWNLAEKKTTVTIKDEILPFQGVAYSPSGDLLAVVLGDFDRVTRKGYVKTFDPASGKMVKEYEKHLKVASSAAFSSSGDLLATTSDDEKIHLYDIKTAKAKMYSGHSRPTNAVLFGPDGRTMISGSGGRAKGKNEVSIWDRDDGRAWALFEAHKGRITSVALHSDGKTLATAGYDKVVKFWDLGPTYQGIQMELGQPVIKKDEDPRKPVEAPKPVLSE